MGKKKFGIMGNGYLAGIIVDSYLSGILDEYQLKEAGVRRAARLRNCWP